jgi:Mg2+/Co2+ transporter CorB
VSQSRVELFTQSSYFFFQLIQVFLIQTLTNAASTALVQIAQQPGQVFNILSSALPTASNFYISYFIVQGLTIATSVVTQVVGFFVFTLLYKLLAKTPRAMYKKWTSLSALSWGSLLPVYTNIAVISMSSQPLAASTLEIYANSRHRHHIFSHCSPDSVLVNY